jgi:outer membrane lipoprotein-sorting protein
MSLVRLLSMAALALLLSAGAATAGEDDEVRAAITRSHAAMVAKGAFRVDSTTETSGGTQKSVVEAIWPDRFRIRSITQGTEFIVVPGGTWMNSGGSWTRMPVDMSAMTQSFSEQALREGLATIANAKVLGTEDVGGRKARVYAYDQTGTIMGIRSESRVKAWIDDATDLVLRMEVDGKAMGQTSRSINVYDWNADIVIDAPK